MYNVLLFFQIRAPAEQILHLMSNTNKEWIINSAAVNMYSSDIALTAYIVQWVLCLIFTTFLKKSNSILINFRCLNFNFIFQFLKGMFLFILICLKNITFCLF